MCVNILNKTIMISFLTFILNYDFREKDLFYIQRENPRKAGFILRTQVYAVMHNNEKIHNAISEVSKGDCIIMGGGLL